MQSQDVQSAGSDLHDWRTPPAGPHSLAQNCASLHAPSPHGNSGQRAQSASGPGTQTPPLHSIAELQQA